MSADEMHPDYPGTTWDDYDAAVADEYDEQYPEFPYCSDCQLHWADCECGGLDPEPDLDFGFEHDSAMTSIGWGTDEDYGYYGGEDY